MSDRTYVVTASELATFDSAEVVEGYMDGFSGDDEPGDNRSKAYWHGWRSGSNDRAGKSDSAQIVLIKDIKANQ